jgi:PAS domain S-box-containing protein
MTDVDSVETLKAELDRHRCELERSERRFRDVIERNADAIIVVDHEGVVRFANPAAATMFTTTRSELVGTHFGFPIVADETTELDIVSSGTPRVVEMRVVESEWERDTAFIATLRDITERKQAEQGARKLIREQTARAAAEALARRLRFLVDSTTVLSASLDYAETLRALAKLCATDLADWVVVYDVDERGRPRRLEVAHADPAKADLVRELRDIPIAGEGPHPVVDTLRTRKPVLVAEVTEEMLSRMSRNPRELEIARALGVASYIQVPMIARDHALGALSLVCSSRPFTEEDLALAQDIAARAALAIDNARLFGEAQAANRTKTDFLAVVSHDLRTPLNAIVGYAQLLELGIPEPVPTTGVAHVQRIRTAARHLLYLLNELLAFARLESGREEVRVTDLDARSIGSDVAAVMEPLARQRQLNFVLDLPETAIQVRTDADKLRQILLNLVGNAVNYTDAGEVRLIMRPDANGRVTIEVRDTGRGIAPGHLPYIFEPFWQVDAEQRSRGGGTGLGLSVVRHLVDLLGGKIDVTSEPGVGSSFRVSIPSSSELPETALPDQ